MFPRLFVFYAVSLTWLKSFQSLKIKVPFRRENFLFIFFFLRAPSLLILNWYHFFHWIIQKRLTSAAACTVLNLVALQLNIHYQSRVLTWFLSPSNWPTLTCPLFIKRESFAVSCVYWSQSQIPFISPSLVSGRRLFANCQPFICLPLSLIWIQFRKCS